MTGKILIWLLATGLLTPVFLADAQQTKKVPRIGFVTGSGAPNKPGALVEAFQQGLRELGYIEGKNILSYSSDIHPGDSRDITARAEGDRSNDIARWKPLRCGLLDCGHSIKRV